MSDTTLKISEIPKSGGIIWKPITFKVVYKFARPVTPSNEPPPLKCLIGDESGLIWLLHKFPNENETDYDKLQVNHCYTIMAGGCRAREMKTNFQQLVSLSNGNNGMELWLSDLKKVVPESLELILRLNKCPLNFEFVKLSKLAIGKGFDILAKVSWDDIEQEDLKHKRIHLFDDSLGVINVKCNLIDQHWNTLKNEGRKGDIVAFYNASVSCEGTDLVIWANSSCAMFLVSLSNWEWILNAHQLELKNALLNDFENAHFVKMELDWDESVSKRKLEVSKSTTPLKKLRIDEPKSPLQMQEGKMFQSQILQFESVDKFQKALSAQENQQTNFRAEISRLNVDPSYNIRRYLGCYKCSKSLRVFEGSYFCDGKFCDTGNSKTRDETSQRKSYFVLTNFTVYDESHIQTGLVAYNTTISQFLGGKLADDFETDNDVFKAFEKLVQNRLLSLIIQAKRINESPIISEAWHFSILKIVLLEILAPLPLPNAPALNSLDADILEIRSFLGKREHFIVKVIPSSGHNLNINGEDEYIIKSKPKGIALHICTRKDRGGADSDNKTFVELFTQLHYKTETVDVIAKNLLETIRKCQKDLVDLNLESLVLCISCHGLSNNILLSDGTLINVWTDVIYQFDDSNFPEFRGRPKIVFINSCQTFPENAHPDPISLFHNPSTVPNHPDFLVFIATSPGYQAFRNPLIGTHFIRTLAYVLMKNAKDMEIKKLFYLVSKALYQPDVEACQKPQLPEIRDFLFKKFYFQP